MTFNLLFNTTVQQPNSMTSSETYIHQANLGCVTFTITSLPNRDTICILTVTVSRRDSGQEPIVKTYTISGIDCLAKAKDSAQSIANSILGLGMQAYLTHLTDIGNKF